MGTIDTINFADSNPIYSTYHVKVEPYEFSTVLYEHLWAEGTWKSTEVASLLPNRSRPWVDTRFSRLNKKFHEA